MPYALIGAVLGEMIAANRGLGYLVQCSGAQFDTAGVFAVLVVIALLAMRLTFSSKLFNIAWNGGGLSAADTTTGIREDSAMKFLQARGVIAAYVDWSATGFGGSG